MMSIAFSHRCAYNCFLMAKKRVGPKKKDPAAVALGRKGGANSRINLTPEQRTILAKRAATARWTQKQDGSLKVHGDPLDTPKKAPAKKKGK
jgi:hypothetical protein